MGMGERFDAKYKNYILREEFDELCGKHDRLVFELKEKGYISKELTPDLYISNVYEIMKDMAEKMEKQSK